MATLKELKVRIGSIKSTQKITKAMKMVSSAKLRRAQVRILSARPFANKIDRLLADLVSLAGDGMDKLIDQREIKTRCVVAISADRGLAGSFNTNIIRTTVNYLSTLPPDTKVVTVGKKVTDTLKKKNYNIILSYPGIFHNLNIDQSDKIVNDLAELYGKKEFDNIEIIYNEFKSLAKQLTVREQFFPLKKKTAFEETEKPEKIPDYIFEPSLTEIIRELIPKQLRIQFWKCLLESSAAEEAARMMAMEAATKNAADLLKILELSYNQARQAAITKEILEIVGGAEALKDS